MVVNAMATVSILIVDAAMMVAELNICDDDVRSGFTMVGGGDGMVS